MMVTKTTREVALVLALVALGAGSGLTADHARDGRPARVDRHGDELPPWAVARIGTARWWHGGSPQYPIVFTPDGKHLAFCDSGKAVRFLDAATGKEVRRIQLQGDEMSWFALSPDGKTMVTASGQSDVILLWDIPMGKQLWRIPSHKNGTLPVTFSPDGKILAALASQGAMVRLWDVRTWQETHPLRGHTGSIATLGFLPDGKTLLSVDRDCKSIIWWDIRTGRALRRLATRCEEGLRTFAFTPDGKRFVGISRLGVLHLWDTTTGVEVRRTRLPSWPGWWFLCFSPDIQTLACSTYLDSGESGR